jgi:hypothetical protein
VEDEIIKELENITSLYIFPVTVKVVVIRLGLIMKKEEFAKFSDWLMSKGFNDIKMDADSETSWLLSMLGYKVMRENKRHMATFRHVKDKKTVYVVYTMDDIVTLESIVYLEQS